MWQQPTKLEQIEEVRHQFIPENFFINCIHTEKKTRSGRDSNPGPYDAKATGFLLGQMQRIWTLLRKIVYGKSLDKQ